MPTGYTHDIYEGDDVTLIGYIIKCARNMGFLISDRDGSGALPDEIPFDPSDTENEIKELEAELEAISILDDEACDEACDKDYAQCLAELDAQGDAKAIIRGRYNHVMQQLVKWTPPEELHELKKFMVSQLDDSISYDCDSSRAHALPRRMCGVEWQDFKMQHITSHIDYLKRKLEKERSINERSNALLKVLKEEMIKIETQKKEEQDVCEEESPDPFEE